MSGRSRALVSVVIAVIVAACGPLPGNTVDPLYLKVGDKSRAPHSPESGPQPVPDGQPARPPDAKPAPAAPEPSGLATSPHVWIGRFRDSRGEGEVTFSLVQSQSLMSGTWKARVGGGGPVTATVAADDKQRWQFRMDNSAGECPGSFEGWLETRGTEMIGSYRGTDCEGAISNGSLELRSR